MIEVAGGGEGVFNEKSNIWMVIVGERTIFVMSSSGGRISIEGSVELGDIGIIFLATSESTP